MGPIPKQSSPGKWSLKSKALRLQGNPPSRHLRYCGDAPGDHLCRGNAPRLKLYRHNARGSLTSDDEGIDGIIKEDRLGLGVIYVQAKRWEQVVGRPEVQKFAGTLAGRHATKGIFITTSSFTDEALRYASALAIKVVLLDGLGLANLMMDHGVGVTTETVYKIKRIDSDYFYLP
jgi:restriction endonuclease Mrr